jgi:hypothetical protein
VASGYGFEMVDAPNGSLADENAHQSKIYTESKINRIFRKFSAI